MLGFLYYLRNRLRHSLIVVIIISLSGFFSIRAFSGFKAKPYDRIAVLPAGYSPKNASLLLGSPQSTPDQTAGREDPSTGSRFAEASIIFRLAVCDGACS